MENNFDNMDEWLKDKLDQTNPVWSEAAWNDFQNLRTKKRRGIFWLFFTGITIIGILASGIYSYYYFSNATEPATVYNKSIEHPHQPTIITNQQKGNTTDLPSTNSSVPLLSYAPHLAVRHTPAKPITNPAAKGESLPAENKVYDHPTGMDRDRSETPNEPNIDANSHVMDVPADNTPKNVIADVTQPTILKPTLPDPPKKNTNNSGNNKIKLHGFVALEYNPSQTVYTQDIVIPTNHYSQASISKKGQTYHSMGIAAGFLLNKNTGIQTGFNIYQYNTNIQYTTTVEKTTIVSTPYTYFRMDTFLRRINKRVDTIYSTVKTTENKNHQAQLQLSYISIPLQCYYQFKYRSAEIQMGGGIVVHHLQKTNIPIDYNENIVVAPWKLNANLQLGAAWKLHKKFSAYTGVNAGLGSSSKTYYTLYGFRTGLKINF